MNNELLYISSGVRKLLSENNQFAKDALDIFSWQVTNQKVEITDYIKLATYKIITSTEYSAISTDFKLRDKIGLYRTVTNRWYIVFDSEDEFKLAMSNINPHGYHKYTWTRKYSEDNPGYEVTSRGDRRYSPFFMRWKLDDGRIIILEDYWKEFIKPLPPEKKVGTAHEVFGKYLNKYLGLFYELAVIGMDRNLTDMFDVNGGQNLTYCDLLNKYYNIK